MDPDLVGATRLEPAPDEGDIIQTFQYLIMCNRRLADITLGIDCHLFAFTFVAGNIAGDGALILLYLAPYEGDVFSFDGVMEKLVCQMGHGIIVFGHKDQAGGALVYTMYQPGTVFLIAFEKGKFIVLKMVKQGVDKGSLVMSHSGMDHQTCGFVDDHKMFIFVPDVKRYVFGHEFGEFVAVGRQYNRYFVSWLYFVIGFDFGSVYQNAACLNGILHPVSGYAF